MGRRKIEKVLQKFGKLSTKYCIFLAPFFYSIEMKKRLQYSRTVVNIASERYASKRLSLTFKHSFCAYDGFFVSPGTHRIETISTYRSGDGIKVVSNEVRF